MKRAPTNRTDFIPKRFEIVIFSFFLSLFMTFIVSGVSTLRTLGLGNAFASAANFVSSWPIASPVVFVIAPVVRKLVVGLIKQDSSRPGTL